MASFFTPSQSRLLHPWLMPPKSHYSLCVNLLPKMVPVRLECAPYHILCEVRVSNSRRIHDWGHALLLTLTLLPLASLLLYFGQGESLTRQLLLGAGQSLYSILPLCFAVLIASSLRREHFGLQAINATLGYLILTATLSVLAPQQQHTTMSCALVAGLASALSYPYLAKLRLPPLLHSFKGPAIILILNSLLCLLLSIPLAALCRWLEPELLRLGSGWLREPEGGFTLGTIYQLLTPFGLHTIFHPLLHPAPTGQLDSQQLTFLSGLYAVKMFGLPGMALALIRQAPAAQRRAFIGATLLLSASGLITGVTEPLLLPLLLISPALFCTHALLAGLLLALCQQANIQFAIPHLLGGVDALWQDEAQSNTLQLYLLAGFTLLLYFITSHLVLRLVGLRPHIWQKSDESMVRNHHTDSDLSLLAVGYIKALGGLGNLISMNASLTYLTVEVENPELLDNEALQKLGVITRYELESHRLQLLIGPIAVQLDQKIQRLAARQALDLHPKAFQLAPFTLP